MTAAAREMTSEIDLGNLEQFVKMKYVSEIEATDKHGETTFDEVIRVTGEKM